MSVGAHRTNEPAGVDPANARGRTFKEFKVLSHVVQHPTPYGEHRHPEHQLAWMREGRMELRVGGDRWTLHHEHMVWLPGNVTHEMTLLTPGEMISAYAVPDLRPNGSRWNHAMVLTLDALTGALLVQLSDRTLGRRRRLYCQVLLYDLLESAPQRHDVLALPRDARARTVAAAILADPADQRELAHWADETGVSTKTLMRAFAADTGTTFARWRTSARMYAALDLLAAGHSVNAVAAQVGYDTASGFISAFRTTFATTPARYAREHAPERNRLR